MQIILNGEVRQVAAPMTAAALIEGLGFAGKPVAVEINRELVPRQRLAERPLAEGDCIEIVTLVGGG
jgi:sulfur carrier protein